MKLFGTSGIRGKYGEQVSEPLALDVGMAIGTLVDGCVAVGMDSRTSGPSLKNAVVSGIVSRGTDVLDLGIATTPTVGMAVREHACSAGVVITASHNPPEYNGIKLWDEKGVAFQDAEPKIESIVHKGDFCGCQWNSMGKIQEINATRLHIDRIMDAVSLDSEYTVAVDCGCGAGSVITPYLLEGMGMRVVSLNCQPTGFFPRGLEPNSGNLSTLAHTVSAYGCDLGVANDGDADRIGAVDDKGHYIDYDVLLALMAGYECSQSSSSHPVVATTVDASMCLDRYIEKYNARVVRTPVGDVALAQEIVRQNADFGGEPSGTWIFPSQWLTPDGVLAAVKILEMMDGGLKLSEERENVPTFSTLREKIPVTSVDKVAFYGYLVDELEKREHESIITIDGVRVEYESGWALYRFSGTEPFFRITVEAETQQLAQDMMQDAIIMVTGLL